MHCYTKMMQFNSDYCTVSHVMVISIVALCWSWRVVHSVGFENSRWAQSCFSACIVGIVMVMKNDDDALCNGNMNFLFLKFLEIIVPNTRFDLLSRLLHQAALWDNADLLEDLLNGEELEYVPQFYLKIPQLILR